MKKSKTIRMSVICAAILFFTLFLLLHTAAEARSIVAVEGAKFDVSLSMKDNLKMYTGKDVVVHLRSGKTLEGYVKSVGNDFVHLEKLAEKDFYDAFVRIDDISAIEAKFRYLK
jgi:small nuclear ribonucleoprotein (snRNP)-like protein